MAPLPIAYDLAAVARPEEIKTHFVL